MTSLFFRKAAITMINHPTSLV